MGQIIREITSVRTIFLTALVSMACAAAFAQRVVNDPETTTIVLSNTATQKAIETEHNKRLDSISSKQEKIAQYAAAMATIKEVYKISMTNISGFGSESKYYIEIGLCAADIIKMIPEITVTLTKAHLPNQLLCLNEIGNLETKSLQLVNDFVNIVNNAKIESPLKKKGDQQPKKDDGYNFLDRYQRLTLANRIYTDLMEIRYKLIALDSIARYAGWNELFYKLDPEGWANVMTMKSVSERLALDWKHLK